jgi:hypothetical protein
VTIFSKLQQLGTEDGGILGCSLDAEKVVLRLLLWDGSIVEVVFVDWFSLQITSPAFIEEGEGNLDKFRPVRNPDYLLNVLRGEFLSSDSLEKALTKYEAVELVTSEEEPRDIAFSIVAASVEIRFEA